MFSTFLGLLVSLSFSAQAYIENAKTPLCFRNDRPLNIDNRQVLTWKSNSRNQFKERAYVAGVVEGNVWRVKGHDRFILRVGPGAKETVEIIYNHKFGPMPKLPAGTEVEVCGDYITSNAPTGRYEVSPAGAIIHWVHFNPGDRKGSANHEHGFIMVKGSTLVGFDEAKSAAWDGEISGFKPGER